MHADDIHVVCNLWEGRHSTKVDVTELGSYNRKIFIKFTINSRLQLPLTQKPMLYTIYIYIYIYITLSDSCLPQIQDPQ